jgi:uncharacterized protein (DUF2235 family)
MSRNLVVCLDGTDNEFSAHNTNVVRLFQALDRKQQLAYYDPGVGTIWESGTLSKWSQKLQMLLGLAFGLGVTRNVTEAYLFLVHHYQPDDRLFLFGFSRGALEARALAALIYRCGLLEPQLLSLEPYAMRLFQTAGNFPVVDSFKETFSRDVQVEFLGLWDTVTSMGNVWSPIHWPNTARNPCVRRLAHAIAIDERRAFFRQNRWSPLPDQAVSEVWFAGVHSDVGGGYDPATGRLWAVTFEWMVQHARSADLLFCDEPLQPILASGKTQTPDYATNQHDSLTTAWKVLELVPKKHRRRKPDGSYDDPRWLIPAEDAGFRGRARELSAGEQVHRTAIERFAARSSYRPDTLVKAGLDVVEARRFLDTDQENWTVPKR